MCKRINIRNSTTRVDPTIGNTGKDLEVSNLTPSKSQKKGYQGGQYWKTIYFFHWKNFVHRPLIKIDTIL